MPDDLSSQLPSEPSAEAGTARRGEGLDAGAVESAALMVTASPGTAQEIDASMESKVGTPASAARPSKQLDCDIDTPAENSMPLEIVWPDELVTDLARRRCVLFLGAGVSANSQNAHGHRPPNWEKLLAQILDSVRNISVKNDIQEMLSMRRFLSACEAIHSAIGDVDFVNALRRALVDPRFRPAEIHEILEALDARVVATVNLDTILESYFNKVQDGSVLVRTFADDRIADVLRSDRRHIIKVHGTLGADGPIIMTRAQYADARVRFARFYRVLDALVLNNTFLFIGCGLSDPDMELAFENIALMFPGCRDHYFVLPKDEINQTELSVISRGRGLRFLTYDPAQSHLILGQSLKSLLERVLAERATLVS